MKNRPNIFGNPAKRFWDVTLPKQAQYIQKNCLEFLFWFFKLETAEFSDFFACYFLFWALDQHQTERLDPRFST